MGTRIKPVQPTVIKDKAIIEQIIQEIRRRPTRAQLAKVEKQAERLMKMFKR
jgi:type II secretory pathway predicted ATPase ExeA